MRLGDYVHSNKHQGYWNYGLKTPIKGVSKITNKENVTTNMQNALDREKDKIINENRPKTQITPAEKRDIEKFLTALYFQTPSEEKYGELKVLEELEKSWMNYINEAMNKIIEEKSKTNSEWEGLRWDKGSLHSGGINEDVIDWLNNEIKSSKNDEEQKTIKYAKTALTSSTLGKGTNVNIAVLEQRQAGLNWIIEKSRGSIPIKPEDLIVIKSTKGSLDSFLAKLSKENKASGKLNLENNGELQSIVHQLNYQVGGANWPSNQQIGEIYEIFGAFMSELIRINAITEVSKLVANDFLGESLKNNFNNALVGSNKITPMINTKMMIGGRDEESIEELIKSLNKGIEKKNQNFKWQRGSMGVEWSTQTQQKADFMFTYDASKEPLAISAKNYSLKDTSQKIHLNSGTTNLLNFIQQTDTSRYEAYNHWMNLGVIMGSRTKKIFVNYMNDIEMNYSDSLDMVRMAIIARALSGKIPGATGTADYFLVNARNGAYKGAHLVSIYNLVTMLEDHLGGYNLTGGYNKILNPEDESVFIGFIESKGGKPMDVAYSRIAATIRKLSALRIGVEMKQSMLNQF